jgi:ferredoxin-NADP reductase
LTLLHKADLFFISSSHESFDMDTNHRGGPPGFVRVLSNEPGGAVLVYPEYSGNRLYQTLGNLQTTPLAGLVFPDFDTGSVLYVTGSTEILVGNDAAALMPRSNLAIKITLTDTRLVERGLSFRGVPFESSPYNPDVRLLVTEGNIVAKIQSRTTNAAKLIRQTRITPSISRFRFALSNAGQYKPGQWVAMDFSKELDIGYSHMRDDDPRSLNDDYVRTFTVSSAPTDAGPVSHDEFEITIRKVGAVTSFLFNQSARSSLNVPVQGFGGDFQIGSPKGEELVPFIAGGVGITPLLPQLAMLDVSKLRLFWTLRVDDVKFALDVLSTNPQLRLVTTVFFTTGKGITDDLEESLSTLDDWKVQHHMRRITSEDLLTVNAQTWYICAGGGLKKVLLQWLHGRTVIFEDFNF